MVLIEFLQLPRQWVRTSGFTSRCVSRRNCFISVYVFVLLVLFLLVNGNIYKYFQVFYLKHTFIWKFLCDSYVACINYFSLTGFVHLID